MFGLPHKIDWGGNMEKIHIEIRGGCLVNVWKETEGKDMLELVEGDDYILHDWDIEEER